MCRTLTAYIIANIQKTCIVMAYNLIFSAFRCDSGIAGLFLESGPRLCLSGVALM